MTDRHTTDNDRENSALFEALPPAYRALRSVRLKALSPAEQIVQHLGQAILRGDHPIGSRIVEQDVANQFAVSRGPVRDALRELHKQGLVNILPRRGTFVIGVAFDDVIDMFNIRGALLSLVVRYVAMQEDRTAIKRVEQRLVELRQTQTLEAAPLIGFIKTIGLIATGLVQACNSHQLELTYRNLPHDTMWRMLWVTSEPLDYRSHERREVTLHDYEHMFASMREHNANSAEQIMRKITMDSCQEVMSRMLLRHNTKIDTTRIRAL